MMNATFKEKQTNSSSFNLGNYVTIIIGKTVKTLMFLAWFLHNMNFLFPVQENSLHYSSSIVF